MAPIIPQIGRPGANVPGGAQAPQQQQISSVFGGLANNNGAAPPAAAFQQFQGAPPIPLPFAPNQAGGGNPIGAPMQSINPLPMPSTPNSGPSGGFQIPSVLPVSMNPFGAQSMMQGPFARDPNAPPQPVHFPGPNDVRPVNPPVLTNNLLAQQVPLQPQPPPQMSLGPPIQLPQPGRLPPGPAEQPPARQPALPMPQPTQPPVGLIPRFPPVFFVIAFVVFLAAIAEVDTWSKTASKLSSKYTGTQAGSLLRFIIIIACLAGAVFLLACLAALAPPPTGPVLQIRPPLPMPAPQLGPSVPLAPQQLQQPQQPNPPSNANPLPNGGIPLPPLPMPLPNNPVGPMQIPNIPNNAPVLNAAHSPFNMGANVPLNFPTNMPGIASMMSLPTTMGGGGANGGILGPFQAPPPPVIMQNSPRPVPLDNQIQPGPFARPANTPAPLVVFPPFQT